MLDRNEKGTRVVLPRWLSFSQAVCARELGSIGKNTTAINDLTRRRFQQDQTAFEQEPSTSLAAELLGSAVILGDTSVAERAASYVLEHQQVEGLTLALAQSVLGQAQAIDMRSPAEEIRNNRRLLSKFPRNAILWMELGRMHAAAGHNDKASRAVTTALVLAPTNRFVVRGASRFFIHVEQPDLALYHLDRALARSDDPWLQATRLNISVLLGTDKTVPRFRLRSSTSADDLLHYSELIETVGLIHLMEGDRSRARKSFRRAWTAPSDNVVAHGEWVLRQDVRGLDETLLDFTRSAQAMTWRCQNALELAAGVEWASRWEIEEPYSTAPFAAGSFLACYDGRPELGVEIARRGLVIDSRDFVLRNNLCFALVRSGRVPEADSEFQLLPEATNQVERVLRLATAGILAFAKREPLMGSALYAEAAAEADRAGLDELAIRARLHLVLAQVEFGLDPPAQNIEWALTANAVGDAPQIRMIQELIARSRARSNASR